MKTYFAKTPKLIQNFFKDYTWKIASNKKEIYLTFDDGPHPEITPWVLKLLNKYNAKATFFCVGENISKYPENFSQILEKKHSTGNHTFNHLNGWMTKNNIYFNNIERTEKTFREEKREILNNLTKTKNQKLTTSLFRPPYGKIKPGQAKKLLGMGFQIIMWDVLSADFDKKTSKEQCLQNVIKHTKNGSIIVFHDSEKAFKNLEYTLPKVLEFYSERGFDFKAL